MYQDKSLLPREAIRLAALGILATGPRSYAALAAEVRNFASRIAGPSLELMGTSIELLRYEGLIDAKGAPSGRDAQHLLPAEDRRTQIDMMIEVCEVELARLVDLRAQHADEPGHLIEWLDREIAAVEDRLEWLRGFLGRLDVPLKSGAGRP